MPRRWRQQEVKLEFRCMIDSSQDDCANPEQYTVLPDWYRVWSDLIETACWSMLWKRECEVRAVGCT
jgi:hypothetical protein